VQAVLAARGDPLLSEEKQLLQTAAVVGTEVPLALLQAIAEVPEEVLHLGLTRLQAAEFHGAADDRAGGPHLELPSEFLAADRTLGLDPGGRLVVGVLGDADEHHVRVLRGEPSASGGAAVAYVEPEHTQLEPVAIEQGVRHALASVHPEDKSYLKYGMM
jgi:hypothetical protein